jgi:predicted dehydrogenase
LAGPVAAEVTSCWEEAVRSDAEIVIVATVNKYRALITIEALKRGKHVLCENPLGRSSQEVIPILRAVEENGTVLKSGFNHRYHPGIFRAKEIVDRGEIGPVYFIRCRYGHGGRPGYETEWYADRDLCGGGVLVHQGVHVVDLFRWFMGDFKDVVGCAQTFFWNMDVEDNAFALFRTFDDRIAVMHASWTEWKNLFSFEVFGEGGYVIVEGLGGSYGRETLRIGKRPVLGDASAPPWDTDFHAPNNRHQSRILSTRRYTGGGPEEEVISFDGPDVSWQAEWMEFISAIEQRRQPLGSAVDGLEANRMVEAVYVSARENQRVTIS